MGRIPIHQILLATVVAMLLVPGCTNSAGPELAEVEAVHPDRAANPPIEPTGRPQLPPAEPRTGTPAATDPAIPDEVTSDSDTPGGNSPRRPNGPSRPHEVAPPISATTASPTAREGREVDGDDPQASFVIEEKNAAAVEEVPLNNGREPTAVPSANPVIAEPANTDPESLSDGRADSQPVDELDNPPVAPPTSTQPVKPRRTTLADLSEAIQTLDQDNDGQLGLYEWPRDQLAEFQKLDANQDGFLTPTELVAGAKKGNDQPPSESTTTSDAPGPTPETKPGDNAKADSAKPDAVKSDAAKSDAAKSDAAKSDAVKTDAGKTDAGKTDAADNKDTNAEPTKEGANKDAAAKDDPPQADAKKPDAAAESGTADGATGNPEESDELQQGS